MIGHFMSSRVMQTAQSKHDIYNSYTKFCFQGVCVCVCVRACMCMCVLCVCMIVSVTRPGGTGRVGRVMTRPKFGPTSFFLGQIEK